MSGTAVPGDFRLPWNTTRSMADVWADERREAQRIRAQRLHRVNRERHSANLEARQVYVTSAGKAAFAGYDKLEDAR